MQGRRSARRSLGGWKQAAKAAGIDGGRGENDPARFDGRGWDESDSQPAQRRRGGQCGTGIVDLQRRIEPYAKIVPRMRGSGMPQLIGDVREGPVQ